MHPSELFWNDFIKVETSESMDSPLKPPLMLMIDRSWPYYLPIYLIRLDNEKPF